MNNCDTNFFEGYFNRNQTLHTLGTTFAPLSFGYSDKNVTAKLSEDNKMILAVDGLVEIEIPVEVVKNLIGTVDVVHCKDCEKYKERRFPDGQSYGWFCQETHYGRNPDDFCSYGVRKE